MLEQIFFIFEIVENIFWTYGGIPMLLGLGVYLSFKSKWFQVFQLPEVFLVFKSFIQDDSHDEHRGVSPIYAFFTSLGGCIGIGNLISVCSAVQIGGPGALFWIWVAALLGMLVKYGEIYLGLKYRIRDRQDSYFGGPMVYLQQVPGGSWLAPIVTVLLCMYGIEIYMFRVVTQSISEGWGIPLYVVVLLLLCLVLGIGQGGVRLVGKISTVIIPVFVIGFCLMSGWILILNIDKVPEVLASVFFHAFTPHAALGAFAGSSVLMSMSYGVRRACYNGDIGVGYASVIHSETNEVVFSRQASMGIVDIVLNTFIVCTLSLLVILTTGTWHQGIAENFVVATSFKLYFNYIDIIWPLFIFLLGYSSILAFFVAGRRSAMYLIPGYGEKIYFSIAGFLFLFFSYVGTMAFCMTIMSIIGLLLLIINLYGLYHLKDEVIFNLKNK